MKMQTEKQYAFESLKPLHHIVEAYHIIIGRLHVLDERNFQTLFEQGMEELYEHLSLIHNASRTFFKGNIIMTFTITFNQVLALLSNPLDGQKSKKSLLESVFIR